MGIGPRPRRAQQRAATRRRLVASALLAGALSVALLGAGSLAGSSEVATDAAGAADATGAAGTASALPTVTALAPNSGPLEGGHVIAITGSGFTGVSGADGVVFSGGGSDTNATNYVVVSATRIIATVPDSSVAGPKVVKVRNSDGQSSNNTVYAYGAPVVSALSPGYADPSAAAAQVVTITGTGLAGTALDEVSFIDADGNSFAAGALWVVSDTQLVVKAPLDDTSDAQNPDLVTRGVLNVRITRNGVASATSASSRFLFSTGAPAVTTLGTAGSPVTGTDGAPVGSNLTLTGSRLWGVNRVNFGSTSVTASADISVAADGNSMTVRVPARGILGPVDVTVENPMGASVANLSTRFTYIGTGAPTISSVSPNALNKAASGGGGTFLVSGSGFAGLTTANVTLKCTNDVTPTAVVVASDAALIVTVGGNGGVAEFCGLQISNALDATRRVTAANALRYV
ncbi:MAG: IPT/TIG domain-containing protein [Acidimicrobiia bacterium]